MRQQIDTSLKARGIPSPTVTPRVDEAMQRVLDTLAELGDTPIETLTPTEARLEPTPADAVRLILDREGIASEPDISVTVKEIIINGPNGAIPLHIYTPPGKGPFPAMMYYHGGGFVLADSRTYDATPRALAKGAGAIMIAVDYHQAPEHKFPAALNDAYAAYLWVLLHAKELNVQRSKVAVGGESAGGNLAALVSIMARDRQAPMPVHQLLIYPLTDNDFNTPSYQVNAKAKPLNKAMMQWFFKHYLRPEDMNDEHALPMKAASLKSLPPATVITAEIDPLRSEGLAYAERLEEEGVEVKYQDYLEVTHEFFGMSAVVPQARQAQEFAIAELKKSFMRN